jgi:peptidoglycan/LPS O-acetylase OafA/YrhL
VWHAIPVANGGTWLDFTRVVWFPGYAILVMFFGLSGFLISGSALRLNLREFLINRGLRIFPALILEITLSALILGPIFTNLSLARYFSAHATYHYFTNIIGWMQYQLPGVFEENPSNLVNWSLWTVPYEIGCYAIMSIFIVYGILRKPKLLLVVPASYMALGLAVTLLVPHNSGPLSGLSESLIVGRGSRLLLSFVLGIAAYQYRHRIPYRASLFLVSVGICFAVSLIQPGPKITFPIVNILAAPALVYATVFIGATPIPKLPIYGTGDYSYGIYLYGLPIQQAVRAVVPTMTDGFLHLIVSVPLITLFAMFSWHVVERPVLKARKRFSFVARARGVA